MCVYIYIYIYIYATNVLAQKLFRTSRQCKHTDEIKSYEKHKKTT